jgi:hypothetical protein
MRPIDRRFQLANDGDAAGLSCTLDGLSLAGAALLRKTAAGFSPRSADEIDVLLKAAYGEGVDPSAAARGLMLVAEALNQGDIGRAMVAALHLRLPDLGSEDVKRIAKADDALSKYDPGEPRDERGRWTASGGPGSAGSPTRNQTPTSDHAESNPRGEPFLFPVSDKVYPNVTAFRNQHLADAIKLAAVIGHGATADEVLAISGKENKYGDDPKAKVHGNFFGIHSHRTDPSRFFPGQTGTFPTEQDGPMASFPLDGAFYRSGLIFAERMKSGANGKDLSNPMTFFSLARALSWGATNSNYLKEVMNVYGLLRNSARASERRS